MGEFNEIHKKLLHEYTNFYKEKTNPEHPLILDQQQMLQKIANGDKIVLHGIKKNGKWALFIFASIFLCIIIWVIIAIELLVGFDYIFAPHPESFIDIYIILCFSVIAMVFFITILLFIKSINRFIWSKSYLVLGAEGFFHHYRYDEFYFWSSISEIKISFLGSYQNGLGGVTRKLKFYGNANQVIKKLELEPIRNTDFKVEGISPLEKKISGQALFVEIFRKFWETAKK
jgi:hypothetical protein